MMNSVLAVNRYFPIHYRENALERVFSLGAGVWLVGFLALLMAWGVVYAATKGALRDAVRGEGNAWYSSKVTVPGVYGVLRPRIVLPLADREGDHAFVLLHEEAHIRRGDNLWRLAACFLTALHWFNPFAWVFLKTFLEDLELACDEAVIGKLDAAQRKDYARSLLAARESPQVFVSAFGGAKLRIRVEKILSYQKMTRISTIGSVLFLTAVLAALLTNGV